MKPAIEEASAAERSPTSARCVLLFSRGPAREGREKRLGNSARLFALARRRVIQAVAGLGDADILVMGAPERGFRHLAQRGRDFGARIENALLDARALGYREVLIVPGDVPRIDAPALRQAFEALEGTGMVLGPSPDGGVWLLGLGPDAPALFPGARWQSQWLRGDLLSACPSAVVLRRSLGDLDAVGDLVPLGIEATGDPELLSALARVTRAAAVARPADPATGFRTSRTPFASLRAPPLAATLAA